MPHLLWIIAGISSLAFAQDSAFDPANCWQAGAVGHDRKMRAYLDTDGGRAANATRDTEIRKLILTHPG